MDEIGLSELMQLIIRDKGGTPQQYNQLMDYIAYHETGPEQRMSTSAKQKGGGPGRGLFQFEVGENKGGNLAVNRTVNYLERNDQLVPQWLRELWTGKKSVDVSSLDANQQKMLFLGYHREHPTSDFSKVWSGNQSTGNFWMNNHWAGTDKAQDKLELFNKSMVHKDSTYALKVKEEELMYKQNMAPYLSDSNNINNLPKVNDILNSIFGAQGSSLIKDFEKGWKFAATGGKGSESHRKFLETDFGKGWEYARTSGNPGQFVEGKYQEGTKDDWLKKLFSGYKELETPEVFPKYDHGGMHLPVAESDATNVDPVITPTKSKVPILTQKMYDIIKESQHHQNILSNNIKRNYLQKLLSGYYNMTRYGNNPHFSQDPEVQRSWWDKITDISSNYRNMGKK